MARVKCSPITHYPAVAGFACGPTQHKGHSCLDCIREGRRTDTSTLCDFPAATKSGTCDRPVCETHGRNVGPNRDYCRTHPFDEPAATSGDLFEK